MPDTTAIDVAVVKLDGAIAFEQALLGLDVRRSLNAVGHAQVRVRGDHGDAELSLLDKELRISHVTGSTESVLFVGEIVGVGVELRRTGPELVIDAYDKSNRLMRQAPIKTVKDVKPSDVISQMAGTAGLSPQIDAFGPTMKHYHQLGQAGRTLADLCRAFGADWWVDDGKLHVRKRTPTRPAPVITLTAGEDLREFTARVTAAAQVAQVGVRGWDIVQKQAITGQAPAPSSPPANSPPAFVTASVRNDPRFWSSFVIDQATAGDLATAVSDSAAAGVVSGRGECAVCPRLKPGSVVTIKGMGSKWSGDYDVTSVQHTYGVDRTFTTRFTIGGNDEGSLVDLLGDTSSPTNAQLVAGLTIGIVTNNNNSADGAVPNYNRVKIKMPYLSDTDESFWARVAIPGGGKERGFVALPEVDDEVLVGFEHGDLGKPVVLGGLWNGKDRPPVLSGGGGELVGDGKVNSRQWVSRIGHRIVLSDKSGEEHITVELKDKKTQITLTKDQGVKVLADSQDLELTVGNSGSIKIAKNGDITIKGQKVTIDAQMDVAVNGMNVDVKAKGSFAAEANGTWTGKASGKAALEANGITQVKGSLVQIN